MKEKIDIVSGLVAKLYVASVMENKDVAKAYFDDALALLFNLRQDLCQLDKKVINDECKCSEPDPEDGSVSTRWFDYGLARFLSERGLLEKAEKYSARSRAEFNNSDEMCTSR